MFGFRGANQPVNPQKIAMAEGELEMVTDLLRRMSKTCHEKCIGSKYYEPDLNKGESVCVDRCVAKYLEVNVKVGEYMAQMSGQNAGMQ